MYQLTLSPPVNDAVTYRIVSRMTNMREVRFTALGYDAEGNQVDTRVIEVSDPEALEALNDATMPILFEWLQAEMGIEGTVADVPE